MIFEKIAEILSEQLGAERDEITMETNILKDLEADSLDVVEVIMALEDEYEIEIPDEDAEQLQVVSQIVKYIEDHVQ